MVEALVDVVEVEVDVVEVVGWNVDEVVVVEVVDVIGVVLVVVVVSHPLQVLTQFVMLAT